MTACNFAQSLLIRTLSDSRLYGLSDPVRNLRESGGGPGSGPKNCWSFRADLSGIRTILRTWSGSPRLPWLRHVGLSLAASGVLIGAIPSFGLQFQSVTVSGFGVRQASFDAAGGLTYQPLDRRGKPLSAQRVVLAAAQLGPIQVALGQLDPTALPGKSTVPPIADMRKLAEPFDLVLVYAEQTFQYHGDARPVSAPVAAEIQALALLRAVAAAERWLDTPPVRMAKGAFEVGVQDGKVGVGVDAWSLYQPLADDPRVEALRPLAGKKVRMEVAWERDRPGVFVLKRLLAPLPKPR